MRKINFHKVQEDSSLGLPNAQPLELDGFVHVAGMVAAGKSTLSLSLSVNILRNHPDCRITLVVSDVQSAIRLVGRSKRDAHLRSFFATRDYQDHWQRGQPHWGDRWLGTACPLQGRLHSSDINDRLDGKPLKPGTEPCHSLKKSPHERDRKRQNNNPGPSYLCPLFATCPSQQMYRDKLLICHIPPVFMSAIRKVF